MADNVRLNYKTKYPLDMVISDQCIDKYNSIFFFLMKIKRINHVLASLWKFLSSQEFRVSLLIKFKCCFRDSLIMVNTLRFVEFSY